MPVTRLLDAAPGPSALEGPAAAHGRRVPHLHLRHHAVRRDAPGPRLHLPLERPGRPGAARDRYRPYKATRNVTNIDETLLAEARRRGEPYDLLATPPALRLRPHDGAPRRTPARRGARRRRRRRSARWSRWPAALLDTLVLGAATVLGREVLRPSGHAHEATARFVCTWFGKRFPETPPSTHPLDVVVWRRLRHGGELAEPVGTGPARLARAVHRDGARRVRLRMSTSTPAARTCASPTTPPRRFMGETATGVAALRPGDGLSAPGSCRSTAPDGQVHRQHRRWSTTCWPTRARPRCGCSACTAPEDHQPWSYDDAALGACCGPAGRRPLRRGEHGRVTATGARAVEDALLDGLDVPRAVAVALEEGGAAARRLAEVLVLG